MRIGLTSQAEKTIKESFELDQRAWDVLRLIVAEFESDPMSVQCFDTRIVEEAKYLIERYKAIEPFL